MVLCLLPLLPSANGCVRSSNQSLLKRQTGTGCGASQGQAPRRKEGAAVHFRYAAGSRTVGNLRPLRTAVGPLLPNSLCRTSGHPGWGYPDPILLQPCPSSSSKEPGRCLKRLKIKGDPPTSVRLGELVPPFSNGLFGALQVSRISRRTGGPKWV